MFKTRNFFLANIMCMLFMLQAVSAQNAFTWARKIGGVDTDAVTAMAKMQNDNMVACGYFASAYCGLGQYNLTNNPDSYYRDFWLALYDVDGNVLWAKSGGGEGDEEATCLAVDEQENIYLAGTFQSYTFSLGSETLYKDLYQNYFDTDAFVCSFDKNGTLRWVKGLYDNGSIGLTGIAVDAQGNLILSGSFSGDSIYIDQFSAHNSNPALSEGFVMKMDPQGTPVWLRSLGGDFSDDAAKVTCLGNGVIALAGTSNSSNLSDGVNTIVNPNLNMLVFLCSIDENGNAISLNAITLPGLTEIGDLEKDASNNLIILGEFTGDSLFFAADTLISDNATYNCMMLKFAADGTPLWGKHFGGANDDFANALSIDSSDNLHVAGSFKSASVRLGTFTLNRSGNDQTMSDAFYACFSSSGECINAFKIGGPKHEAGTEVISKSQSEFWLGGQFSSNSILIGEWLLESGGGDINDGYIAHFAPLNTNPELTSNSPALEVFPNPTTSEVYIQIPHADTPWQLELFDSKGDVVQVVANNQPALETAPRIALNLPEPGVFLMRIRNEKGCSIRKIVRLN